MRTHSNSNLLTSFLKAFYRRLAASLRVFWPSRQGISSFYGVACGGRVCQPDGMSSCSLLEGTWTAFARCGCRCAPSGIGLARTSCSRSRRWIALQRHVCGCVGWGRSVWWRSCRTQGSCIRMVFSLVLSVLFLFDNRYYIIIIIIAYILSESELSDKIKAPHGQINLLSNLIRI